MKITLNQLAQHCEQAIAPVILISGNEPVLIREAKRMVCHYASKQGFSNRIPFMLTPYFDWTAVQQALANFSLLEGNSLIILQSDQTKIDKTGSALLAKVAAGHYDQARLLMITPKCDATTQRSTWFKAISSHALFLPIWPLNPSQWTQWFQLRCQRAKLNLSQTAFQLACDYLNGDLTAATQLIEQLRLSFGSESIDLKNLESLLLPKQSGDVFQLCDTVLAAKPFVNLLNSLQQEGLEITIVLWALLRELRTLIQVAEYLNTGTHLNDAVQQAGVWAKRQALIKQAVNRHPLHTWHRLLQQAMHIDHMAKGVSPGLPWDAVTQLCLALSGQQETLLYAS